MRVNEVQLPAPHLAEKVRGNVPTAATNNVTSDEQKISVAPKGKLINPFGLNDFFRWVNGVRAEASEKDIAIDEDTSKHNYFCLRDLTKAIWPLYLPLQIIGLFNERAAKLAKAWYGACWSIVYSCYRPWRNDRDELTDEGAPKPISHGWKNIYNVNEHFRVGMGSIVSGIYGSGAFGMLWGAVTGNDDFFEKSAEVYKTGMLNQNQIFASMNADIVMRRKLNLKQLKKVDKNDSDTKAKIEMIDTLLFIPNIITRGLDTLRMFGLDLSEGLQRVVNSLGYFSYGTWAARFGTMKTVEEDKGGDLVPLCLSNPALYHTQKYGGEAFRWTLPIVSWFAAGAELLGFGEAAKNIFKLEGILERLNPAIFSWCFTDQWFQNHLKLISPQKSNKLSRNPV